MSDRIEARANRKLLIDSNLLLLLTVGAFEPKLITTFKRLSDFSATYFFLLRDFSIQFQIVSTPHIFTEISNLANSLPTSIKPAFFQYLSKVIRETSEHMDSSAELAAGNSFVHFGLTDAALCRHAYQDLVLTEDGRLRAYLQKEGAYAIGLAEVRQLRARSGRKQITRDSSARKRRNKW